MRHLSLSTRLTAALCASALVLVGSGGAWQLSAEEADLRRAVERELRLVGRSLQVAFENALRDRQAEDVEETLRALERIDPTVDIYVYDRRADLIAMSTGAVTRPLAPDPGSPEAEVRFREGARGAEVELRLPLRITTDQPPATLVLVQPLHQMREDLAATRQRIVLSTIVFVLAVFLVAVTISRFSVSVPLARMVAHMRRVRAGDLSPAVGPRRGADEIGATLTEFDALVHDLAIARTRLETEGEARRRVELALREVDKLATVGQLAAGLAHEIGSPLQILEGRIAGLEAKADDPVETRRLARILREQTQRITRIVSRLADVARRPATPPRLLDPGPPVRAVVDLVRGEARRRGVELSLELAGPLPSVWADPDSIQQLALNLLRNALDATLQGGSIVLRMAPTTLARPDGPDVPAVRLEVSDTGRGMVDQERERVFEPFFTTRAPEGSGLGLAVVKGIVDEHRGRVQVTSTVGVGTTFTVDLPCEGAGCAQGEIDGAS